MMLLADGSSCRNSELKLGWFVGELKFKQGWFAGEFELKLGWFAAKLKFKFSWVVLLVVFLAILMLA